MAYTGEPCSAATLTGNAFSLEWRTGFPGKSVRRLRGVAGPPDKAATGAPRQRGCPPWVVLGARVVTYVFELIADVILAGTGALIKKFFGVPLSESGISETWIGVGVLAAIIVIVVTATRLLY